MFIEELKDDEVDELMEFLILGNGYSTEDFSTISVFDKKTNFMYMVATNKKEDIELEIAANDFVCLNFNQDTLEIDNENFNIDSITIKDLQSNNSKILRSFLKRKFGKPYKTELENFANNLNQNILSI